MAWGIWKKIKECMKKITKKGANFGGRDMPKRLIERPIPIDERIFANK